jgi:hypothetical protein
MGDRKLVKYTNHAKLQMKKRNISEEQVMIVLNFPDEFRQGSHSNETIAIKRFNRKRVRVVYVSEPDEIRIITVTH